MELIWDKLRVYCCRLQGARYWIPGYGNIRASRLIPSFRLVFLIFFLSTSFQLQAQEDSKFTAKGYLKFLQTVMTEDISKDWYVDNLIHNRIDTKWYPTDKFTAAVEFRNRIFYGASINLFPGYEDYIGKDPGYWDLSWNLATGDSYIFNTTLDRVWIDYTSGDFQARLGRQRINWGQNLVWNPNDVFNAYSFFDFDYEERPGTDALRMQYYTSYTSQAEFVYQIGDSIQSMSFAGNYRFNKWNYDFQFLGGYVKNDAVFGTGWSGDIKGGGFRGEFTYFHSLYDSVDSKSQLVGSISGDYTFRNSLYLHAAAIYNSKGATGNISIDDSFLLLRSVSAKYLTLSPDMDPTN